MPVDIGSRLLVTWRDRTGHAIAVTGTVSDWYEHEFSWGTLRGAVLLLDRPFRARGIRLDAESSFDGVGASSETEHLLVVPRYPTAPWPDSGTVQVELRLQDPSVRDVPGWWLSADGDYEVRTPGAGWSRRTWRRLLTAAVLVFAIGTATATIGTGGATRHLAWPGTPEWSAGAVAAVIGGVAAILGLGTVIRALWVPRVRNRAQLMLALMLLGLFFCAMLALFIATYGDPGPLPDPTIK
jgi:hypothetical protein